MSSEKTIGERLATIEANQDTQLVMLTKIETGLWDKMEPRMRRVEMYIAIAYGAIVIIGFILGHGLLKSYDRDQSSPRRPASAEYLGVTLPVRRAN